MLHPSRTLPSALLAVLLLGIPARAEEPEGRFIRGDANADGRHDISDAIQVLRWLFGGDRSVDCPKSADTNDDGSVDISDPVSLLGFLFLGQAAPPQPFGRCGLDPTRDDLPCSPSQPLCAVGPPVERLLVLETRFAAVRLERCGEPGGCSVKLPDAELFADAGDPRLLVRAIRLVLPPDALPTGLSVRALALEDETIAVPDGIQPEPGSGTFTEEDGEIFSGREDGGALKDGKNPAVYATNAFYPGSHLGQPVLASYRGWRIATIPVYPVRYNPVAGELRALRRIEVELQFTEAAGSNDVPADTIATGLSEIRGLVAAEGLQDIAYLEDIYDVGSVVFAFPVDILIVTAQVILDESAANGLDDFIDHKEMLGLHVKTVTVELIDGKYSSGDLSWKIREYIRERQPMDGFDYVLLVGNPDPAASDPALPVFDPAVVPMAVTEGGLTDVYYADLDEDWDPDGDGLLAEDWGETGYPDLAVGRIAPVGGYVDDVLHGYTSAIGLGGQVVSYTPNVLLAMSREEKLRSVLEKLILYDLELDKSWRELSMPLGSYMFGSDDGTAATVLDETARLIEVDNPDFGRYSVYQDGSEFDLVDSWFDGVGAEASGAMVGDDSLPGTSTALYAWSSLAPGMVFWRGHGSSEITQVGGGGNGENSTKDGYFIRRDWVLTPEIGQNELDDTRPAVVFSDSCSNMTVGWDSYAEESYGTQRSEWASLAQSLQYRGAIAVVAATDVTWLLTSPPEDPTIGYGDWYQRRWLRKLARGSTFGDAFVRGKMTAQENFADKPRQLNKLKNWLRFNLLADPSQGMFLDPEEIDDAYDSGNGNDNDDSAAVIHDGPILPSDNLYWSVSVEDAVAVDADWYSLRNIGTGEKDLTVELDWSGPVEELDLSVRDRNGQPISGLIATGPSGKTFTTRQPVTVSEVRIEVAPTTHAGKYDLVVKVD